MHLTQALHRAVQQTPDLPATVFGDRVRTWAQSRDRIARLAGALTALGLTPGDRVALLALNSDVYHEYLLAVPWAGGVVVPVNTRWRAPEIGFSLADSGTRFLAVDNAHAALVPGLVRDAPGVGQVVVIGDGQAPAGNGPTGATADTETLIARHAPAADAHRHGSDPAGIYYTGGTTGTPKGVVLTHDNLVTSALGAAATGVMMEPGGRFLHAAPMFHLADLAGWTIRNVLGGTHIIVPAFTPTGVAAAIEAHQVTDALLVPTMIQMLVDAPETADADLTSLRNLIYGASPISEAVLDRTTVRLPGARLVQAYGMTELSPVATLLTPGDHLDPRLRRSAGRAVPHAEVQVVDASDREVPRGQVGEVVVRGDSVMSGYWNRPDETADALRNGWMHTGDAAYMDEQGYLFVVDRLKDMIVTGGENVYSAEVENAVAKHPAVAACAVIGVPDDRWGERVHAVVVLTPGRQATAVELQGHARQLVARYKVPRSVEFVAALPLSGAGKVLKRELRATYWSRAPRAVS